MLARTIALRSVPALAALALSLSLVSPTLAATWLPRVWVADAQRWSSLVVLSDSSAAVIYEAGRAIYSKNSLDAGTTWSDAVKVTSTRHRGLFEAAGHGSRIDIISSPAVDGYIKYYRSKDGGVSFLPPRNLDWSGDVYDVAIARGCCGRVALAWTDNDGTNVRVSGNGGRTFGDTVVFDGYADHVALAIADGTIYLAEGYYDTVAVRRSLDGGMNWTQPITIASGLEIQDMEIAAGSGLAFLAYQVWDRGDRVYVSGSSDMGLTWSPAATLNYVAWQTSPHISVADSVARLTYRLCTNLKWTDSHWYTCLDDRVDYVENVGGSWGSPEVVAADGTPRGIGFLTQPLVLLQQGTSVYVKARAP